MVDGTQTLVSRGLNNVYHVEDGGKVPKPSCPLGLKPSIELGLGYVKVDKAFQLVGSQKPYIKNHTEEDIYDEWEVGLELRVRNINTGKYDKRHTGSVLAITQCK